jgi:hypothetical protein
MDYIMSLILQSSGGGQITIQEPATASNFTQTLPAASGEVMVSGNQPAFSAYQSVAQTLASNTYTKITFTTEEFDTNNNFASSRFTPTVAGYYQITGCVSVATSFCTIYPTIYKNGGLFKFGSGMQTSAIASVSSLIYLNGSTDYVEIYANFSIGQNTQHLEAYTWFNGSLVRAA